MRGREDGTACRRVWRKCSAFYRRISRCDRARENAVICVGGCMKNVIVEYAGAVIAVLGTVSFFVLLGQFFLGRDGMIAILIAAALGGI